MDFVTRQPLNVRQRAAECVLNDADCSVGWKGGLLLHRCATDFQRKIKPALAPHIDSDASNFSPRKGASAGAAARFGYNRVLLMLFSFWYATRSTWSANRS